MIAFSQQLLHLQTFETSVKMPWRFYTWPPGPGGYCLICVIRVCAAGQGMVFWPRCPKTGYTIWLASVLNRFRTCPKRGMVLRAERLKPRLRAVSFFSSPATSGWALWEVERACAWAADKRRVSFPDLRNINWVKRPLPGHYNVINQHQIIFWTRMLLLSVSFNLKYFPVPSIIPSAQVPSVHFVKYTKCAFCHLS